MVPVSGPLSSGKRLSNHVCAWLPDIKTRTSEVQTFIMGLEYNFLPILCERHTRAEEPSGVLGNPSPDSQLCQSPWCKYSHQVDVRLPTVITDCGAV